MPLAIGVGVRHRCFKRVPSVVFARPGKCFLFFDVTPQGSKQIVKRFEVKVAGQGEPLMKEDLSPKKLGDLTITFESHAFAAPKGGRHDALSVEAPG